MESPTPYTRPIMPIQRTYLSGIQSHHLYAALEALPKPLVKSDAELGKELTKTLGFPITRSHVAYCRNSLGIPPHRAAAAEPAPSSKIAILFDAIAALEARVTRLEAR